MNHTQQPVSVPVQAKLRDALTPVSSDFWSQVFPEGCCNERSLAMREFIKRYPATIVITQAESLNH